MADSTNDFEEDIRKSTSTVAYVTRLPGDGLAEGDIMKKVDEHLNLGSYKWREGRVSGAVYYYDPDLVQFVQTVYGKASYTNPLHPDIFPGVCKMEVCA